MSCFWLQGFSRQTLDHDAWSQEITHVSILMVQCCYDIMSKFELHSLLASKLVLSSLETTGQNCSNCNVIMHMVL